jgi:putative hydrolase of the HAD superfamily
LAGRIDAAGFSCLLGVRKPHPDIYLHVTGQLDVAPRECAYVGDGDSRELSGAVALGMVALWLRRDDDQSDRYDDDSGFAGPEIARLRDLPASPLLRAPMS